MTDLPNRFRRHQGNDLARYVEHVDWMFLAAVAGLCLAIRRYL